MVYFCNITKPIVGAGEARAFQSVLALYHENWNYLYRKTVTVLVVWNGVHGQRRR